MVWSTQENVPDMTGKTVLITGCTSGLGREVASQLLQRNATIVMACRNAQKMDKAAVELEKLTDAPSSRLLKVVVDVSDLDSVRAVPTALQQANVNDLHAIVLNAGIACSTLLKSKQNVELTFATNVLGHWLLTKLLLPFIAHVPLSRIVAVGSLAHSMVDSIDYSTIRGESAPASYSGRDVYKQTKLGVHWFVNKLNHYLEDNNVQAIGVVAHPGYANSEMTNPFSPTMAGWNSAQLMHTFGTIFRQSTEQGAWPLTLAASNEGVAKGHHYGPANFFGCWGPPVQNSRRAAAAVDNKAKENELWEVCEELTGETYAE